MSSQWTEDLATGIDLIDDQHRELYRQVSLLHEAMRANALDRVTATFEFLQAYVQDHFATEEREMAQAGYPALPEHVELHRAFVADFLAFRARVEAQSITPSIVVDLSAWLGAWLGAHVRKVDGAMARYLQQRP